MISWNETTWTTDIRQTDEAAAACADMSARAAGLISGTRVATTAGWRDVTAIVPGDRVLTFDGGLQAVCAVRRHVLSNTVGAVGTERWPLFVSAGALGNLADLVVMPGQPMLIESDVAEEIFGDPFVAVHGSDLEGLYGVMRVAPEGAVEVVTLHFASNQVVFVAGGALALCEGTGCLLDWTEVSVGDYRVLDAEDAELVLLHGVSPAGSLGGTDAPRASAAA